MKRHIKVIISYSLLVIFFISSAAAIQITSENSISTPLFYEDDFDPLVDVEVTVEIQTIRSFDKYERQLHKREYIDFIGDPDLYVKIIINDEEFTSDIWQDTKYIYSTPFSATLNVPDDQEFVDIIIQLWDWNKNGDKLCDIGNENDDANLIYSIKTGHWTGDDEIGDPSGYGRLNGCDDGSIYKRDMDCELWFSIYQNDYDGDMIPYWTEVNEYGTNPEINNIGDDDDNDNIPIEWEWKWGYDPFQTDNHGYLDPENDAIDNEEEYLTVDFGSDPFRKDMFVELDQMDESPSGQKSLLPEGSKELLYTAHNRQNIVYHLDDGNCENSCSDIIPFDESTTGNELRNIYYQYFQQGGDNSWRRGVFHYGVLIYHSDQIDGHMFGTNRFQVSAKGMEQRSLKLILDRDTVYASAYMHENGHILDFRPIPGHDQNSKFPWQIGWWLNRPYRSCMNYGYMYTTVDYSDGSRGSVDLDDWERMDLAAFQRHWQT